MLLGSGTSCHQGESPCITDATCRSPKRSRTA
jgi:hypothetical protein